METKEKAPNYTAEQVAEIVSASPLNMEKAKELAAKFGKSYRSVIAKAKTLEGVEYQSLPPVAKKPTEETKAEIVQSIEALFSDKCASLFGLEKATTRALVNLRQAIGALPVGESVTD
jgi:hypothetical protein